MDLQFGRCIQEAMDRYHFHAYVCLVSYTEHTYGSGYGGWQFYCIRTGLFLNILWYCKISTVNPPPQEWGFASFFRLYPFSGYVLRKLAVCIVCTRVNVQSTRRRDTFFDENFNFLIFCFFKKRMKDSKNREKKGIFMSKSLKDRNPPRYLLWQVFSYFFSKLLSKSQKAMKKKIENFVKKRIPPSSTLNVTIGHLVLYSSTFLITNTRYAYLIVS